MPSQVYQSGREITIMRGVAYINIITELHPGHPESRAELVAALGVLLLQLLDALLHSSGLFVSRAWLFRARL